MSLLKFLQADGGTRCAALAAASVALADAGIPMRDMVSAMCCRKSSRYNNFRCKQ